MFYWQDFRYAVRLLTRSPAFTLLTVIVLAGGLGLSIFTFSFLHTAILKPVPLPQGETIVRLMSMTGDRMLGSTDAADFNAMRGGITTVTDLGVYGSRELVVGSGEGTRSFEATASEWNIFQLARTAPLMGRGFTAADQEPGAEPVVVLTYRTWQSVFAGEANIVNSIVQLSGVATRVVGVMPKGFGFPVASDAWVPINPDILKITTPDLDRVNVYGRLVPGVSMEQATAELTGLMQRVQADRPVPLDPRQTPTTGMSVQTYPIAQIGDEAPLVIAILNTLAALILVLACINVTNLLLARANERARETAVRLALGAPRGRLIMQSVWESVLLCVMGGVLATALATWGLVALNTWAQTALEGNLTFWWVWGFDRSVLIGAGGFVTLAIIVLGGIASRRAVNTEINAVLQEGASRSGSRKEGRIARLLVTVQVVTVSLLLFFGSIAAIVAYQIVNVDFGYKTNALLSAGYNLPEDRYATAEARGRFFQAMQDQLSQRAEINGAVTRATLSDEKIQFEIIQPGGTITRGDAYLRGVLGTLGTLGISLSDGRDFDGRDDEAGAPTVMISQSMATQYWPGRSPVGSQIRFVGRSDSLVLRTVVGVVSDVLMGSPFSRDRTTIGAYLPLRQTGAMSAVISFRHRGSEPAARAAYHEVIGGLDPLIASDIRSFDEMLAKMTVMARSVSTLFGGAFAFALLLAVSGTYGLMARSISRRTREIGVRRALGATDRTILTMLVGQGARQLGVGAVIALPFTLAIGYGFSLYFPISFGVTLTTAIAVSLTITAIVMLATWVPTRRAIAIEPRDALWRE
jgi:predicted permease